MVRILLAEDNFVNQKIVQGLLEKSGHRVEVASNGVLAVERLKQDTFDLVLMDVQMPEMDGITATKLVRQQEQASKRHTPIIAMTANAMKGDREKCLEAGEIAGGDERRRALGVTELDEATVETTLGTVLKYREDQERARQHGIADMVKQAFERGMQQL